MKVHLDNFHIAGFGYWDGCEAFEHLKIGTRLDLVRITRITPDVPPEQQVEVIIYIKSQK